MKRKFYSMEKVGNEATINIYGDISSWSEDVNAKSLVASLDSLTDVAKLHVYINSYGGEVAEGLAIYNALRRHKAKVITYCDGFACSIASVIFMAGDERIMSDSSLLMIHNAWIFADGNANELRKAADDLDKITEASIIAYKTHSNLSEDEIKALMDSETWITPQEAIEYGFATAIEETQTRGASQSVKETLLAIIKAYQEVKEEETDENGEETTDEEKNTDNTENKPENEPATDETDTDDKTDEEEETTEENSNKAEERLFGFFNAILKI